MDGDKAVILVAALRVLACLAAVVAAGYLAFFGKDGWGWFLLAAVLLGEISIKYSKD